MGVSEILLQESLFALQHNLVAEMDAYNSSVALKPVW